MKTLNNKFCLGLTAIAAIMASGCQSSGTSGSSSDTNAADIVLAPAQNPGADPVGTVVHALKNGKPITYTTTAVNDDTETVIENEDCSYTDIINGFAPSFAWENCNGSTGTQTITKTKGSPWPMSAGVKFSYQFHGSDGQENWSSKRKCHVSGAEHISTQIGEFDTYKIDCKDSWSKRTWWYAPEEGRTVLFKRKHYSDPSRSYTVELVKVESP